MGSARVRVAVWVEATAMGTGTVVATAQAAMAVNRDDCECSGAPASKISSVPPRSAGKVYIDSDRGFVVITRQRRKRRCAGNGM